MGLKLLLVFGLALLMSIPALFVFGLLMDRTNRAEQVSAEIGELMGGPQTFLGPVIAVPYTRTGAVAPPVAPNADGSAQPISPRARDGGAGVWYIFPERGSVDVTTDSEVRRRSLFRVTAYEAQVAYQASFDLSDAGAEVPNGYVLDWSRAELLVGASDARGARSDISLTVGARTVALAPSSLQNEVTLREPVDTDAPRVRRYSGPDQNALRLFSTALTAEDRASGALQVTGRTTFSGAEQVAVLAFAGTTEAAIRGDWKHHSYSGFLPERQGDAAAEAAGDKAATGFNALWSVPYLARSMPNEGDISTLAQLGATQMSVRFVEPANPYQSVSRSLKYAPMFIGIVFLAFFMFETINRRRVHPAQYILVGMVQVIFYMLLLSIAEHTGFDFGFLIAAVATVGLIAAYSGWIFDSRKQGVQALVAFSFLYGLIYILMRLNDFALLVGSLTCFAAIAAVMYLTRKVDWYGVTGPDRAGSDAKDVA